MRKVHYSSSAIIEIIRIARTIIFTMVYLLSYCSAFIPLFMATDEGRYYLEILLQEPFRAFLKAVIEISQNPLLILMFLQMGFFAFVLGFVADFILTRLIDKLKISVRL